MIRSEAIRAFCRECCFPDPPRICEVKPCPLYRFRMGHEDKKMPLKDREPRGPAIKRFCRECTCSANGKGTVIRCCSPLCALYEYRA